MTKFTTSKGSDWLLYFLVGLCAVFSLSFFSVMLFEAPENFVSRLLGVTGKAEILKFLGIGIGGMLVALQALSSHRRAKAMEDAATAQSAATHASNMQIVAQMRQAWIDKLRELLAELLSSALHYHLAGYENRTDKEYKRVTLLETHVKLMLNPNEEDHQELKKLVGEMVNELEKGRVNDFQPLYAEVMHLSPRILKREWDRVRQLHDGVEHVNSRRSMVLD